MGYKTIYGTDADDIISTYSLEREHAGYDGFEVFGENGNDTLNSSFIGRNGFDRIHGGEGNDFLSAHVYSSDYATALFTGDTGTDRLYIPSGQQLVGEFRRPYSTITEFTISGSDGSLMEISVSDTVETISFGSEESYLTEDIANGRIRTVDWSERYARTYNENADWYLKGLNTYDDYITPTPEDPAAEDPTPEDPAAEDPAAEDPAAEDPAAEDPAPQTPKSRKPSLVSNRFTSHTQRILEDRGGETLYYYIEKVAGVYELADGKIVDAFNHSPEDIEFISGTFKTIDEFIDLDFKRTYDHGNSDIDIYTVYDVSGWEETTLGQVADQGSRSSWWDILWKDTDGYYSISDTDKTTIVHEIAHALGLSHPNEDPTNPAWDQNDTIMSYNSGLVSQTSLTDWDIAALQSIWGAEDDQDPGANLLGTTQNVRTSTWSESIEVNRELLGTFGSGVLQAKQIEKDNWSGPVGSVVTGSAEHDVIRGLAGWDILDGGSGNDLIHGGNGRDIITGGPGSDELHGDFGWNTFTNQKDGSVDLIAIKSDQFLDNWWYEKSGNSPNGEKSDIIEGLDESDQIKIIGVFTSDLSFTDGVRHKGVTGVGIYAKGVLEALYTGGDLSASQISAITTGDASELAVNNRMWSYWSSNSPPVMQA